MTDASARLAAFRDRLAERLEPASTGSSTGDFAAPNRIAQSASHDFTHYLFAFPPYAEPPSARALAAAEEDAFRRAIVAAVEDSVPQDGFIISEAVREYDWDGQSVGRDDRDWSRSSSPRWSDAAIGQRLFRQPFQRFALPLIAAAALAAPARTRDGFIGALSLAFRRELAAGFGAIDWRGLTLGAESELYALLADNGILWEAATARALEEVPPTGEGAPLPSQTHTLGAASFAPFERETVNFGLQLVYRQVWVPVGTQVGEIVRTIPLGPGQKERVSIKTVRRTSQSRTRSESSERETNSEDTASTRDSTEIVEEARDSSSWNAEVKASGSFGFGEASVSAGYASEQAASAREAKSRAAEAMQKASDRLRLETKVVVSSEVSEERSVETISEIINANDETAVTYVYSKLQRRYELFTYLAEVNTVAFVAEAVPSAADIDQAFLDRHAGTISAALTDDRLATDLARVLDYHAADLDPGDVTTVDPLVQQLMAGLASKGLPDHASAAGSPPDSVGTLLSAWAAERERVRAENEARRAYDRSLARLSAHIADNALHFGRRIALAEDGDSRMLRYRGLRVPARWTISGAVAASADPAGRGRAAGFVPIVQTDADLVPLTELLGPAGPVGVAGNYLVFDLRNAPAVAAVDALLAQLRLPFLRRLCFFGETDSIDVTGMIDPGYNPPARRLDLVLTVTEGRDGLSATLEIAIPAIDGRVQRQVVVSETAAIGADGSFVSPHARLFLDGQGRGQLAPGQVFTGTNLITSDLEDPDFAAWRWNELLHTVRNATRLIPAARVADLIARYGDDLGLDDWPRTETGELTTEIAGLDAERRSKLIDTYLLDGFTRANRREVLLDTDNLVLERIVDDASSLEPFRATHRTLDLLRAVEEVEQGLRESDRMARRLAAGMLDDPDVDQKVIVTGSGSVDIDV